jgi:hypothetical protein
MKRISFLSSIILLSVAIPVFADPVLQFNPAGVGGGNAGHWLYNGDGTLSFTQDIAVVLGLDGSTSDTLIGSLVYIPNLAVSGNPGGPYTLTPASGTISIKSSSDILYMSGTLSASDLIPVGTTGLGYTDFKIDIANIVVTAEGLALNSAALNAIVANPYLDFELSLNGGPSKGFKWMLDNDQIGSDGFSGAMRMVIPEPATILLLGLGAVMLRKNKKN